MAQHFLLSAAARSLSLKALFGLSDDEAHDAFMAIRFEQNNGSAYCPDCGCLEVYRYTTRRIWRCKGCRLQFSVTSKTIFSSRKLPIRDYLVAIAIYVNSVKGVSALELGRDLDVQYKTAFVLAHKLREALGAEQVEGNLWGESEVDGAYFGGHSKEKNRKADRLNRTLRENQTGKRQVVVVLRQRNGKTLPFVFKKESEAIPTIRQRIAPGTVVHADESRAWDTLHANFDMRRINHGVAFSLDGACTNQAESYFSRLRRAEVGQHHHISGKYLLAYAAEMAWREDNRRQSNGALHLAVTRAALAHPVSRIWKGYWQRSKA